MAPKRHVKNEDSRRVARRTVRVDHLGELEEQGRMASAEAATWQVKCRLTQEQAGEIYNEMAECCEMAEAELATRRADSESVVKRLVKQVQLLREEAASSDKPASGGDAGAQRTSRDDLREECNARAGMT